MAQHDVTDLGRAGAGLPVTTATAAALVGEHGSATVWT